jgi:hypothetical protein
MPFAAVFVERVVRIAGGLSFERKALVETNDLGEYRAFGLPAGDFIVSVGGGRVFVNGAIQPMGVTTGGFPRHNYYPHVRSRRRRSESRLPPATRSRDRSDGCAAAVRASCWRAHPHAAAARRAAAVGVIRGRVVRADGLPVRRARVRLSSAENLSHHSRADRRRWR